MKLAPYLLGSLLAIVLAFGGARDASAQIQIVRNGAAALTVNGLQFQIGNCGINNGGTAHNCAAADNLWLALEPGIGAGVRIYRDDGIAGSDPLFTATGGASGVYDLTLTLKITVLNAAETVTAAALGLNGSVTGGVAGDNVYVTASETSLAWVGTMQTNLNTPTATATFSAAQVCCATFNVTKDIGLSQNLATVGAALTLNYVTQRFTPAPEPASIGAFVVGMLGLRAARNRRKAAKAA